MKRLLYAFCIAVFASVFVLSCSGDEFYDGNPKDNLELEGSGLSVIDLNIPNIGGVGIGVAGSISSAIQYWVAN